jgi:hypothetical protein
MCRSSKNYDGLNELENLQMLNRRTYHIPEDGRLTVIPREIADRIDLSRLMSNTDFINGNANY